MTMCVYRELKSPQNMNYQPEIQLQQHTCLYMSAIYSIFLIQASYWVYLKLLGVCVCVHKCQTTFLILDEIDKKLILLHYHCRAQRKKLGVLWEYFPTQTQDYSPALEVYSSILYVLKYIVHCSMLCTHKTYFIWY